MLYMYILCIYIYSIYICIYWIYLMCIYIEEHIELRYVCAMLSVIICESSLFGRCIYICGWISLCSI